jgi:hypothetical protein
MSWCWVKYPLSWTQVYVAYPSNDGIVGLFLIKASELVSVTFQSDWTFYSAPAAIPFNLSLKEFVKSLVESCFPEFSI